MVYTKVYAPPPIPLPRTAEVAALFPDIPWPVDEDTLVWLTRESFVRQAENDYLELTEFRDCGEVPVEDIPPLVERQLGRPATDFVWRRFEGVAQRGPISYWLGAEALHQRGQEALAEQEAFNAAGG